jgi:hypothetical protein
VQNKGYKQQSLVYREKGIIQRQIIPFTSVKSQFTPFIFYIPTYISLQEQVHRCLESICPQPCRINGALRTTTSGNDEETHCCRIPAFCPGYLSFLRVSVLIVDNEFQPRLRDSIPLYPRYKNKHPFYGYNKLIIPSRASLSHLVYIQD